MSRGSKTIRVGSIVFEWYPDQQHDLRKDQEEHIFLSLCSDPFPLLDSSQMIMGIQANEQSVGGYLDGG